MKSYRPQPATAWSASDSDPLRDMQTWAQRMRDQHPPFRPPPLADGRRPAYADLTLHLGDGRKMVMRLDSPTVQIDRDTDFDTDVFGGSPLRRISSYDRVRVTLEGRFTNPPPQAAPTPPDPPAPPAPPAAPAGPPARAVADFPGLADLGRK